MRRLCWPLLMRPRLSLPSLWFLLLSWQGLRHLVSLGNLSFCLEQLFDDFVTLENLQLQERGFLRIRRHVCVSRQWLQHVLERSWEGRGLRRLRYTEG